MNSSSSTSTSSTSSTLSSSTPTLTNSNEISSNEKSFSTATKKQESSQTPASSNTKSNSSASASASASSSASASASASSTFKKDKSENKNENKNNGKKNANDNKQNGQQNQNRQRNQRNIAPVSQSDLEHALPATVIPGEGNQRDKKGKKFFSLFFECPYCGGAVQVEGRQINCGIFRHGILKSGKGRGINPHSKKEDCEKLAEEGAIYGCGKPFRIHQEKKNFEPCDDKYYILPCDYI